MLRQLSRLVLCWFKPSAYGYAPMLLPLQNVWKVFVAPRYDNPPKARVSQLEYG